MRSKPLKLGIRFWGLARPNSLQGGGKQLKIKKIEKQTKLRENHIQWHKVEASLPIFCLAEIKRLT
jgi:hypothetical protein